MLSALLTYREWAFTAPQAAVKAYDIGGRNVLMQGGTCTLPVESLLRCARLWSSREQHSHRFVPPPNRVIKPSAFADLINARLA
jgi:hypothetical protein